MKLSISNIGWNTEENEKVYGFMKESGFTGLEIAPTKIFPENPYEKIEEARQWAMDLKKEYGFTVSSMQSIWFGRQENIFRSAEERKALLEYTKKAILFAEAVECNNLVFGCPRNRNVEEGKTTEAAGSFFKELGDFAAEHHTVLAMEANPPIYNTNYINDTQSALELVKAVNSPGFLFNLDVGTMIQNEESVEILKGNVKYINHVHISEPGLKVIQKRKLHQELVELLNRESYDGYVSIEMGTQEDVSFVETSVKYLKEVWVKN